MFYFGWTKWRTSYLFVRVDSDVDACPHYAAYLIVKLLYYNVFSMSIWLAVYFLEIAEYRPHPTLNTELNPHASDSIVISTMYLS